MSGVLTAGLIAGGLGLAGSVYGANKAADAAEQSRELPDWLKPYITGGGDIPSYIERDPLINTNWMDYVMGLGQGDMDAQWQPMTGNSPWFQPDKTFTPEQGGGPYGQLPPGMDPYGAPPPQQQAGGLDTDALTAFMERMNQQKMISGMEDLPWGQGQQYNRGFRDMDRGEFNQMSRLYELIGSA